MKLKSAYPILFFSLLALVVVIGVPSAVSATMNPLKFKSKATNVAPKPEHDGNESGEGNYTIAKALSENNPDTSARPVDSTSGNNPVKTSAADPSETVKKVAVSQRRPTTGLTKVRCVPRTATNKPLSNIFKKSSPSIRKEAEPTLSREFPTVSWQNTLKPWI